MVRYPAVHLLYCTAEATQLDFKPRTQWSKFRVQIICWTCVWPPLLAGTSNHSLLVSYQTHLQNPHDKKRDVWKYVLCPLAKLLSSNQFHR